MDTFGSYALTLKIALAASIIRSKPPNTTFKDYIQHLRLQLEKNEVLWRTKATKLQHELENKTCEIVMLKLKAGESSPRQIDRKEQKSKTEVKTSDVYSRNIQDNLLRSVISLEHWHDLILAEDATSLKAVKSSVLSSLQDLDRSLSKSFCSYAFELVMKSIETLTELLKKDSFGSDGKIVECCASIVKRILLIMFNSNLQNVSCRKLQNTILLLAQASGNIARVIVEDLVLVILGYSDLLKDTKDFFSFDELKYEKMFFMCNLLSAVISCCALNDIKFKEQCLKKLMDLDLLSIGSVFPIYSHSIWSIISILSDIDSSQSVVEKLKLWNDE